MPATHPTAYWICEEDFRMHNSVMSVQNQMRTKSPFQHIQAVRFGTGDGCLGFQSCFAGTLASEGYPCIQNLPNTQENALPAQA